MHLLTKGGIINIQKKGWFTRFRCKHTNPIVGQSCSPIGLTRISGMDMKTVCKDCGTVLVESSTEY